MNSARGNAGAHHGTISRSVHSSVAGNYDPPLPQPQYVGKTHFLPGSLPGSHLLIEMFDAKHLSNEAAIENALRSAAGAANATILTYNQHIFTPEAGITAVALLAESHISIHTWPEQNFAALDIFMCGSCNPFTCLPSLTNALRPSRLIITWLQRGLDEMAHEPTVRSGR